MTVLDPRASLEVVLHVLVATVELRAVVLSRVAQLRAAEVEPEDNTAVLVLDRHLGDRLGHAWKVEPPEPEERLARRLRAWVGDRGEIAELYDAAHAAEPSQPVEELGMCERVES